MTPLSRDRAQRQVIMCDGVKLGSKDKYRYRHHFDIILGPFLTPFSRLSHASLAPFSRLSHAFLTPFSRLSQLDATPHTPYAGLYFVTMRIRC